MTECKLNAHPTWYMYWKKLLVIVTLSCSVRSIRLYPECPWRARMCTIVPEESVQYWYLFLFPPPPSILFFHLLSDHWGQHCKYFQKILFSSSELNCPIIFSMHLLSMTKKMNQFLRYFIIGEWIFQWFNIGPSSFPNRKCSWRKTAGSLLRGFALAFDRHPKSFAFNFNAYSSSWSSGISCSLLFKFITNLFGPWEVLTQEWVLSLFTDEILMSTPYFPCKQQVVTSNTGPILVFHWIHPCGCDASSSLGRVYSRQATAWNCENSAVSFVVKYCPISTTLRNPASIQNLLNLSCSDSFSIRSPYCCNRRSLWTRSSLSKGTSVLITLNTN